MCCVCSCVPGASCEAWRRVAAKRGGNSRAARAQPTESRTCRCRPAMPVNRHTCTAHSHHRYADSSPLPSSTVVPLPTPSSCDWARACTLGVLSAESKDAQSPRAAAGVRASEVRAARLWADRRSDDEGTMRMVRKEAEGGEERRVSALCAASDACSASGLA